jgi:hypothetical protein
VGPENLYGSVPGGTSPGRCFAQNAKRSQTPREEPAIHNRHAAVGQPTTPPIPRGRAIKPRKSTPQLL